MSLFFGLKPKTKQEVRRIRLGFSPINGIFTFCNLGDPKLDFYPALKHAAIMRKGYFRA
jgi:hypothetical protein